MKKSAQNSYSQNVRLAKKLWGPQMNGLLLKGLKGCSEQYRVDIASGDLLLLDGAGT